MITLSNSHLLEYMAASGASAYRGRYWPWEKPLVWMGAIDPALFTHVTKTLTWEPRVGNLRWWNPFGCIRVWVDGTLNAVGLTNPGFWWWYHAIGQNLDSTQQKLVASITGNLFELREMAKALNEVEVVAVELNCSCPNTGEDLAAQAYQVVESCTLVHSVCRHPLIAKLSVQHPWPQIVPHLKDLVEAISINSVPWSMIYPGRRSPLHHLGGGGMSGSRAQQHTWPMIRQLVHLTDIPVIGCSVWTYPDLQTLWHMGVGAISFGAVHIPFPTRPTWMVRREKKERRRNRAGTTQCEIGGKLAQRALI